MDEKHQDSWGSFVEQWFIHTDPEYPRRYVNDCPWNGTCIDFALSRLLQNLKQDVGTFQDVQACLHSHGAQIEKCNKAQVNMAVHDRCQWPN